MKANSRLIALALALSFFTAGAVAQDRPSWRTDTPERSEAPEEVERPDFEFTIDREDLMMDSGDMGMPARPKSDRPALEEADPVATQAPAEAAPAQVAPVDADPVIEMPEPEPVVTETDRVAALTPAPTPVEEPVRVPAPQPAASRESSDFRLNRINNVPPEYPRHAWLNRQEGWVDLRLTVGLDGSVEHVDIVDAEPRRVFEKAALRAAMRWRFEPPSESGVNEPQTGTFRVTFKMDG